MSFLFATFFWVIGNAQPGSSGVYLSQADFENNNLTYSTDDSSEKTRILFNEFFDKPFITVIHSGKKTKLFKEDIFAYKNKGNIVRTWNFTSYNFVEKDNIWIYCKIISVSQGKGIQRERRYFYSVTGKSRIMPLTILSLKNSFPDNHRFHVLLDAQFRSDKELSLYDSFSKKLKVNHLLDTAHKISNQ